MEPHSGSAVKLGVRVNHPFDQRASMEPHSGSAVKRQAIHLLMAGLPCFNGAALWERGETQHCFSHSPNIDGRASMEPHSGSAVKRRKRLQPHSEYGFNGAALWERGETACRLNHRGPQLCFNGAALWERGETAALPLSVSNSVASMEPHSGSAVKR